MPVTLKDVAEHAGVSYATVSRVLASKPNIADETRARVMASVNELGYRPNRTARSLKVQRSAIIGLIISDIQYDFFPPLVRAVEDQTSASGYGLFLCNSDENPDKELTYTELLIQENVAGVIIAPTQEHSLAVTRLISARVPVVVVDRRTQGARVDTVVVDNVAAAYMLTQHLIENNYTRIGAIVGTTAATTARERLVGYRRAMADAGHTIPGDYIHTGAPREDVGNRLARELLTNEVPPQAIFASNHLLASGAFQAIKQMGLRIARDVALVAFDNPTWASLVEPPLTVIAQPVYTVGETAAQLLLKRIDEPDLPAQSHVLRAEMIVRESSRAFGSES